jgi:hydrogenase nickel incorporation protein HypA/HybF
MQAALDQALATARNAGAARVHEIRLRVGALSGVVPEALEIAFQALTIGTSAEHARLIIEGIPARYRCVECNDDFAAAKRFAECPRCGRLSRELIAGREMELTSMEVE